MAFTKFSKVVRVKYAGTHALHPYISSKQRKKMSVSVVKDSDPFPSPWGLTFKQCNTKWKMSKDKQEIYAICPHRIKFILDERQ